MAIDDFRTQADAMRGLLGDIGVTEDDYTNAAAAKKASLLDPPEHFTSAIRDEKGTFGLLKDIFFGEMKGPLGQMFAPDYVSRKAQYGLDLKDHAAERKRQRMQQLSEPHFGALTDDATDNDIGALRQLAAYDPDIYGPVLRDALNRQVNPTEETMFAPNYQMNPQTGQWEMVQTGNQGTTSRTGMGEGFVPESRMWSPDAKEKAIGEVNADIQKSDQHIYDLTTLGEELAEIGPDNWSAGMQGKLGEEWKQLTGSQDKVTLVRTKYRGIRNALAVQNLPPGVASDKDISMVLEGFPDDFSNHAVMSEYVQSLQRAEQKIRSYHQFRENWLSTKGTRVGMQEAWKESQEDVFNAAVGEKRTWQFEEEE